MSGDRVAVLSAQDGPELDIVMGTGTARAVVWPGAGVGARLRSMHRITLGGGSSTIALSHPGEAVYAIVEGAGEVRDESEGTVEPLITGSMVHVEPGTSYRFVAGGDGMEIVGGPAPADPALYDGLEV